MGMINQKLGCAPSTSLGFLMGTLDEIKNLIGKIVTAVKLTNSQEEHSPFYGNRNPTKIFSFLYFYFLFLWNKNPENMEINVILKTAIQHAAVTY